MVNLTKTQKEFCLFMDTT